MAVTPFAPMPGAPPIPRTRLIGRESERSIARTLVLEEAVPLLTLTGPGGVGKTRLALAIAQEVADHVTDGVLWVDLAPLTDPTLVPSTIAAALTLTPAPDHSLLEALIQFLRPRQMVVLLDNCEHLLASVGELVAALLLACPALQVLATSRVPLSLQAEQVVPVAPLPLPSSDGVPDRIAQSEAVQLFVDRARARVPDFALTPTNATVIAAICQHLDGLPLAIELAAARVNALPPAALLTRLERRLSTLTGGRHDAPARQQTMREAIAWSYALLTPEEQSLFRHLAVFVGGFTLEAAEAVMGAAGHPPDRVADGVVTLVNASLLHTLEPADGSPRFGMLETIREYGLERLVEQGEAVALRDAHAAWCVTLAEQEGTQPASMRRVAIDYPNLRAALDWLEQQGTIEAGLRLASALLWVHWTESHAIEGLAWLARVLAREEPVTPAVQARALLTAGALAVWIRQDQTQALTWLADGEALAQALGDQRGVATALFWRTSLAEEFGDDVATVLAGREATLVHSRALGDPFWTALSLLNVGEAAASCGDLVRAKALCEEGLTLSRSIGAWSLLALAAPVAAEVHLADGHRDAALACCQEGLQHAAAFSPVSIANALTASAVVATACQHPRRAARLLGAVHTQCERMGRQVPPAVGVYQRCVATTRAQLETPAWVTAWEEGRTLAPEAALADALAMTQELVAAAPSSIDATRHDAAGLTPREREILRLVVAGKSNPEIGEALFISHRTVATHLRNIYDKLGVGGRAEAIAVAIRRALL